MSKKQAQKGTNRPQNGTNEQAILWLIARLTFSIMGMTLALTGIALTLRGEPGVGLALGTAAFIPLVIRWYIVLVLDK